MVATTAQDGLGGNGGFGELYALTGILSFKKKKKGISAKTLYSLFFFLGSFPIQKEENSKRVPSLNRKPHPGTPSPPPAQPRLQLGEAVSKAQSCCPLHPSPKVPPLPPARVPGRTAQILWPLEGRAGRRAPAAARWSSQKLLLRGCRPPSERSRCRTPPPLLALTLIQCSAN